MGVNYYEAKTLWEARAAGLRSESMMTIGHQQLFLHPSEVTELLAAYRKNAGPQATSPLLDYSFGEYFDRFCRDYLGVTRLEIIDYSSYEGATIIHDMNKPIPEKLQDCFDVVLEAGSLEHIFNFPVAIANIMQMAKVGGTVFMTTPANNLCGHGFYQFSPELMFRCFSTENGFEAPRVVFLKAVFPGIELTRTRGVFEVADPATVGCRVGLRSKSPIMMMVQAKKTKHVRPFETTPLQSDYMMMWGKQGSVAQQRPKRTGQELLKRIVKCLPVSWMRQLQGYRFNLEYSLWNRRFYRKLK
jgi:hypothetical protein